MPVATTRKRKQADDMVDPTPPKRVTRARAAKTEEESAKVAKPTRSTKITTASTRAIATAKTTATRSSRAATKKQPPAVEAVETQDVAEEEQEDVKEESAKPVKTRGRPKKVVHEEAEATAPKTRTRQTKTVTEPPKATAAATTRASRAKKVIDAKNDGIEETQDSAKPTATATTTRKITRGRAATTDTKPASVPAKRTTAKKKVTFEDGEVDDKENLPAPVAAKKKTTAKTAGMLAKPVRKPATTTRATRGRKAAASKTEEPVSKPLSPKKATQVAKSTSSGSEDELCSSSPTKTLSKSPVKPPARMQSPMKRPATDKLPSSPTPVSPIKNLSASIFASPAKRAPQSPFKDTLKESPKRVPIPGSTVKPSLEPSSQSPFKETLKASPKRINLAGSVPQPQFSAANQSPFKRSLLQSPARRPASPLKTDSLASPKKMAEASFDFVSPSKGASTFKLPSTTPQKMSSAPHEGGRMEEESTKAHHMTPAEQAELRSRETSPSPAKSSPYKLDAEQLLKSSSSPCPGSPEQDAESAPHFPSYRSPNEGYDSEDELQSGPFTMVSPLRLRNVSVKDFAAATPVANHDEAQNPFDSAVKKPVEALSMTPLALQLGSWCASSPQKRAETEPEAESTKSCGIASPAGPTLLQAQPARTVYQSPTSPPKLSHFDEQMFGYDQGPIEILEDADMHQDQLGSFEDIDAMDIDTIEPSVEPSSDEQALEESQSFEQYGDENAAPVDPLVIFAPVAQPTEHAVGAASETVHTPEQMPRLRNREIHTVSKVPLRPSDDGESPIKVPRKRAKSFGPLAEVAPDVKPSRPQTPGGFDESDEANDTTSTRKVSFETHAINQLLTPAKDGTLPAISPVKTVRKGADAQILRGAVIHVDVHTSEGADASGVFIELLTSMGAKCVKQWTWNPRASAAADQEISAPKVGITHVVYKDGGKRTLQKVREAKGLVLCVGVGWVLHCESENKWLDETPYAVDTSTIPRGGSNRRKSMEPTRLSTVNGNLFPTEDLQQTPRIQVQSPTKEFLSFSAESRRSSIHPIDGGFTEAENGDTENHEAPSTPTPNNDFDFDDFDGETNWGSPTTPYFLSKGAQLVQMTCPPKQTMQSLFPVSGRIEDHPDEHVRRRLLEARRKSLQWAPKVGSPLAKGVFGRSFLEE